MVAAGRLEVVMVSAGWTIRLKLPVAVAPLWSVTSTPTVYGLPVLVPAAGVPLITPLLLMLKPVGRPVAVTLTLGAPPAMARVLPLEYSEPTSAAGSAPDVGAIEGAADTVRVRDAVAVTPLLSFTETLTVLGPSTVDVPLIVPVALLVPPPAILKPVGNPVAVQLV
jgi:hypothetical protein